MADDSSEPKKYPPSQKKLNDLAKKGQFPKTELLDPTVELLIFPIVLIGYLYFLFDNMNFWVEVLLSGNIEVGWDIVTTFSNTVIIMLFILKLVMTMLKWTTINRSLINTESIGFKMDNINPINGAKKIFGSEGLSKSLRKIVEMMILLFLMKYIYGITGDKLSVFKSINNITFFTYVLFYSILMISIIFFLYGVIIGIMDFLIEKFQFHKKNMSTFTEMKNEMKESEGSPEIKAERRQIMREIADSPMTKGRKPNFAVANPEHILVPICYDKRIDRLPVVLQIKTEVLAMEERKRLHSEGIPIIVHKPLAQAFHKKMKDGQDFIPKEFFKDIAVIISALKRHKDNAKKKQQK